MPIIKTLNPAKTLVQHMLCCLLVFVSIKVSGQYSFNHYHAEIYKGKPARLVLKGNKTAEMFRTIIKETYYSAASMRTWHGATGLNFAGHYCFVYWGCGSPCQMSAVVDLKTGIVYDGPPAAYGYKFKRNSRLVLVNPGDPNIEYWVWNDHFKKFNKLK